MSNPDPFALQSAPLPRPKKIKGLGDVAHWIAKPIAVTSDHLLGTDWQSCHSCEERRKTLNQWVPFKNENESPNQRG